MVQVYASSDIHVSASEFETLGNTGAVLFFFQSASYGYCERVVIAHVPRTNEQARFITLEIISLI
jgi:hypothetical protein